jgi:hypothetical protein
MFVRSYGISLVCKYLLTDFFYFEVIVWFSVGKPLAFQELLSAMK